MKKLLGSFLCMIFLIFMSSPAIGDMLVVDIDPPGGLDTNPDWVSPTSPEDEEEWLEGLLGLYYDDPSVEFISKDETGDLFDDVPDIWTYAILKYGGALGHEDPIPTHWAFWDSDNSGTLDFATVVDWRGLSLPTTGLSHTHSFSGPTSVPEPATMLLLGFGLIGLGVVGRKKFRTS